MMELKSMAKFGSKTFYNMHFQNSWIW